jgi:hypothetical protein
MKKIIFLSIIYIIALNIEAQVHDNPSKIAELGYLFTNTGHGIQADLSFVNKKDNIHRYSLSFDNGKIGKATTTYKVFKANYTHFYSMYVNDIMYFNAGGGGFLSYETQKNDMLNMTKGTFSPGVDVVLEIEIFYQNFGLFISGSQLYRPLSDIGKWEWRFSMGLKYVIK